jgi:DMSO reductase anchor subunit
VSILARMSEFSRRKFASGGWMSELNSKIPENGETLLPEYGPTDCLRLVLFVVALFCFFCPLDKCLALLRYERVLQCL